MFGNLNNRPPISESIKRFFKTKTPLSNFILANIFVFFSTIIIGMISGVFSFLFNMETPNSNDFPPFIDALMLPSSIEQLITKPWTIISYQFLHVSFWHIFFNMFMLYISGKLFLSFLKNRQFIWVYLMGGIMGGIFYVVAYNFFPVFGPVVSSSRALGASASILAILTSIAVFVPNYQMQLLFIGNVKLKWIAVAFVLIDLLSIDKGNPGGHFAHLGGAFWGLLAGSYYSNPFFLKLKKFFKTKFKKKPFKVKYQKANQKSKPISDEEYNAIRAEKQRKMDLILDKISKHGYDKLSKEEKEFLFKSSNKN